MTTPAETTSTRWRRRGEQARSYRTQDAILDAAERLFAERGIEGTSVTDVAALAGRSIGSLYHHFENKETLVAAVVERITDELEVGIARGIDPGEWTGQGIGDIVRRYIATSLALSERRPGYKRITVEVSLTDPIARERYRGLRRRLDEGLTALLLARRDEIGHPDPETAARFVVDQLSGMLTARLDRDMTPTQLEDQPDGTFAAEAVASVRAYLRLTDD